MIRINQAIIAAGGFGTRLKPYTDTMPKPMIPILGKPLLEWHVDQFRKHGVTNFFFTLHYLPEVVMNYFGDGLKWGVKINYFVETAPLGSAGAIKKFELSLDQLFYYIYGDTFSLMDYTRMREAYESKGNPIGIQRMKRTDDYADADVAELGENGAFIKIHAKPHVAKYPNAYRMGGSFIFDKRILSYIPDDGPYELGKQLLPAIVDAGEKFYAYECDNYSKGIDTLEKWQEVEEYLRNLTTDD